MYRERLINPKINVMEHLARDPFMSFTEIQRSGRMVKMGKAW